VSGPLPSSAIYQLRGPHLRRVAGGGLANPRIQLLHDRFRAVVLSSVYPCVLGASVMRTGHYAFAVYDELGSAGSARLLATDLEWFVRGGAAREAWSPFETFISIFDRPCAPDETEFDELLWRQLNLVHEVDRQRWHWDPLVSNDPEDPFFSFSVAGRSFFVVGMHPHASRLARVSPLPALVFNRHDQFEQLRTQGQMERVSRIIRAKDRRLQGHAYSALAQFGEASEARQYAGREVGEDWRCPFSPTGNAPTAG
jgi:FPC/CPF motif-containing protein YcgG